jgi:N-6 DNA Methylase
MKNAVDMPVGVDIQGNLIAPDLTTELLVGEIKGQAPENFGLAKGDKLADEIATAWGDAKAYWAAFQRAVSRLSEDDPATTVTREQWVVPLLRSLGYDPVYVAKAEVVEGQTYAISHRAEPGENKPPVHIIGSRVRLEQRPPSGTPRLSAHALVQEYLNRTEHLWSVVTNGLRWRLLRDSTLMTRLTYVEFDLEQILNGENFAEFGLFYRLFHRSRLPESIDDADECLLEFYHQESLQQGGRVRDRLRDGVESALKRLGTGFLQHPQSQSLREKLEAGTLTEVAYYRQLLMLIYRLLFLMVAESRNLLLSTDDPEKARIYREYYSIERLRALVERPNWRREGFQDLWQGLRVTFQLFDENWRGQVLGLSPLDGDLFGSHALVDLEGCGIDNHDLMLALRGLSLYEQKGQLRRVNYGALDVEELGSVYESLLEFHPNVSQVDGIWEFQLVTGSERKTTGSYYTPPELVGQLIKSALEPVIADRLASLGSNATIEAQEQALLKLKVCDPACGSGHFLLAAARRIGKELARVRTGEMQPGAEPLRVAIRDVIQHCIYGVDLNPLAVDLCKVALWLEGLCRGLSLNFLDHRIKCGNSLVGVLDLDCLKEGIPDNAYKPVTGDDATVASRIKKKNKNDLEDMQRGQLALELESTFEKDREEYAKAWREIEGMKDDDPAAVHQKQKKYERSRHLVSWLRDRSACNLWTAAFFMPLTEQNLQLLPTSGALDNLLKGNWATQAIVDAADQLAEEKRFFHWPLEYPEVFEQGGFDCLLGNPPWELLKIAEKEFFASRDPNISKLAGNVRKRAIEQLSKSNPKLVNEFNDAKRDSEAQTNFLKESKRFPFTVRGTINTYAVFTELARDLISTKGRAAVIVKSGIATDDGNKEFIQDIVGKSLLVSLFDFTNKEFIFQAVKDTVSFALLTLAGTTISEVSIAAQIRKIGELNNEEKVYSLSGEEIRKLNPNTLNLPILRSKSDLHLVKQIYSRIPIFENELPPINPWGVKFGRLFDMAIDSILFKKAPSLENEGYSLQNYRYCKDGSDSYYVPLYESKLTDQYNHRFATFEGLSEDDMDRSRPPVIEANLQRLADSNWRVIPRYWIEKSDVEDKVSSLWKHSWLIGFRNAVNAFADSRSVRFTILPKVGIGNSIPVIFSDQSPKYLSALVANFNSLVLDYIAKQKIGGGNLNYYVVRQFPILPPDRYTPTDIDFIAPRVLELTYTAWDLQPFAQDMGYDGEPFIWNPEHRALLRAELDAYYAHLYGLTRDELRYILDPADIYGPDFPSETFRVLKNSEMKQFGEYRTQRLVLAAWDKLGF